MIRGKLSSRYNSESEENELDSAHLRKCKQTLLDEITATDDHMRQYNLECDRFTRGCIDQLDSIHKTSLILKFFRSLLASWTVSKINFNKSVWIHIRLFSRDLSITNNLYCHINIYCNYKSIQCHLVFVSKYVY